MSLLVADQNEAPLRTQRWSAGQWHCPERENLLGGLGYGMPSGSDGLYGLRQPLLGTAQARIDTWLAAGKVTSGRTGAVHWRHDGRWLHGSAAVDVAEGALSDGAYALYRDVFNTLQQSGFAHLLRLWNYLPRINALSNGLERYRQFNIGRQQAFLDSGVPAFDGAPAACAIGTDDGALTLHFLAMRQPPLAVENPRQVSAYRYPSSYGPRAPTFSRAALADMGGGRVGLWISGTASIVGHHSVHEGDVIRQSQETVANLQAVIAAARELCSAPLALGELVACVYVRHAQEQAAVQQVLDAAWGGGSTAARQAVYVQGDICRAELRVEVEGHMVLPGRLSV
jgi:chorismate lyase / 3-hydroxybenzoate synthase